MCQISVHKDCYGIDCETCPFKEKLIKEQKIKKRIVAMYVSAENRNIQATRYNDALWDE